MSFLRMAAKQSPLNSRMRSGKRLTKGLNSRSGRSATISWAVSASASKPFLDEHGVARATSSSSHDEPLQPRRHRRLDLEPDHVAAAAALQRGLERAHQVLRLLLHLDVAVAQHAERALARDLEAGEQLVDEDADHRLDADEADSAMPRPRLRRRQPDEALELARDRA